jgi:NADPH:quinone reductase
MRAIRQTAFGGPEVLVLREVPDLVAGPGVVRIDVRAAGVHLVDATIRSGRSGGPFPLPDLPMTPGREVAGTIDAVGDDVDPSWRGRSVVTHLGQANGGYASQAPAPVAGLIPLDEGVDPAEAVAMVGTGRTALGVLEEAALAPDDVVVVTAAAGGLGSLLVQAADRAGATVVGVAGGPEKVAVVRSLGADVAVDYRREGWDAEIVSALDHRRVSVVLDGVGGEIGRRSFELIAPGGRMVLFGFSSGAVMPLDATDLFARGVAITAAIGPRMFARPGGIQALAEEAVARLARGHWRPVVDRFPLGDAAEAHRALVGRRTTGKVVLIP